MSTPPPSRSAPVCDAVDTDAIRAAFGRLSATLTDVAATADRSVRARCPHRGVGSRCFYSAGCRNQVHRAGAPACGGDARVRFDPIDPETHDRPPARARTDDA